MDAILRSLQESLIVTTAIAESSREALKEHREWLAADAESLARHREQLAEHDRQLAEHGKRIVATERINQETALLVHEIGEKLDALIAIVDDQIRGDKDRPQ